MRLIALFAAVCAVALAQAPVNVSIGPPPQGYAQIIHYDAGGSPEYICTAPSVVQPYRVTVTTATNANPVVITATAHGLQTDNAVTISGFTGNWAAVNGTRNITVVDANSFSVAVDSTAFGAYGAQAPTVTANSPRTNQLVWAISKLYYTAGLNVRTAWASGNSAGNKACDSRTTYSYQ